ncbi:MAG TPA: single-stranded DNA-binding protein [Acidimicrobiales bacterium]|jgi:single-stranded DNA-binding protein|nr:single-stranded DNA-binding protein [Acidimicrobiales bacterium]
MPNIWIGHGQLIDDPELRHGLSGKPVTNLRFLVGALDSDRADVFEVVVYGGLAEKTATYLAKRRWILVEATRRQPATGGSGSPIEIVAKGVSFLDAPDAATEKAKP